MRRKSFDALVSVGGVLLAVVLVAAGALLLWAYSFTNSTVTNQLSAQKITFPTAAAFAQAKPGTEITPGMIPYLEKYAGQQLTTGAQAEAYANHFIAVHLQEIGGGKTYSELSGRPWPCPRAAPLIPPPRPRSRPCSRAPRCGACCSTPTAGGRWARSPLSPASSASPWPPSPWCCRVRAVALPPGERGRGDPPDGQRHPGRPQAGRQPLVGHYGPCAPEPRTGHPAGAPARSGANVFSNF